MITARAARWSASVTDASGGYLALHCQALGVGYARLGALLLTLYSITSYSTVYFADVAGGLLLPLL